MTAYAVGRVENRLTILTLFEGVLMPCARLLRTTMIAALAGVLMQGACIAGLDFLTALASLTGAIVGAVNEGTPARAPPSDEPGAGDTSPDGL